MERRCPAQKAISPEKKAQTPVAPLSAPAHATMSRTSHDLPPPQASLPDIADPGKIRFGAAYRLINKK